MTVSPACPHGALRRKCEVCDLLEEVERLKALLARWDVLSHGFGWLPPDKYHAIRAGLERLQRETGAALGEGRP